MVIQTIKYYIEMEKKNYCSIQKYRLISQTWWRPEEVGKKKNTLLYTSTYTKWKNRQTKCGGTGQNSGYLGGIQIRTEPKGTFCDAKKWSLPWSR